MGKRSPRDTTPPDLIINWENEAERVFIESTNKEAEISRIRSENRENPWYERLTGAARDDFFSVPAAEPEEDTPWWRAPPPPKPPGLPPEFGMPRLPHEFRQKTLRIEGANFLKNYIGNGGVYHTPAPEAIYDELEDLDPQGKWMEGGLIFPESDHSMSDGYPGGLTAEGMRVLDTLPNISILDEIKPYPYSSGEWMSFKRANARRWKREMEQVELI